jgi:tripartite-type tricarboxylate transporter receptor subunit TctC
MRLERGLWSSLLLLFALLPFAARAEFPDRPITLIVPFAAGGPTDQHLRVIAKEVGQTLGQAVAVENRPGPHGMQGVVALMRAAPDGYTLAILAAPAFRAPHIIPVPYDLRTGLTYIMLMTDYTFSFVAHSDARWKSWSEFVAEAAARPGLLNVAVSGGPIGTPGLALEEAAQAAGVKLNIVPYKGDADVVPALLGGHIDAAVLSGIARPHVEAGKMRYLAALTEKRINRIPDLPTLKEQGVPVWIESPYGLVGPRAMPPERLKRIHDAFKAALESPASRQTMDQLSQQINYKGPDEYREYAMQVFSREKVRMDGLRKRGLLN